MTARFTPVTAALGGALIGLSAVALMYFNGRVAGVSGIAGRLLAPRGDGDARGDRSWRLAFLAGLLGGGAVWLAIDPGVYDPAGAAGASLARLGVAGALVGVGTQLGNGCTSGHGVCGLAQRSPRSLVAVLVFMSVAALTVFAAGGAR